MSDFIYLKIHYRFQFNSHLQVCIFHMSESIEYYIVHVISLKEHILSDFGNKNKKIVYITKT